MVKWIVIALIGLIFLSYLGFDIRKAIDSPVTQSNFQFAKEITINVWQNYLKKPVVYIWNELFINYIYDPLINVLNKKVKGEDKVNTSVNTKDALFIPIS